MLRQKLILGASTIAILCIFLGVGSAQALHMGHGENMRWGRAQAPKALSVLLGGEGGINARGIGIAIARIADLPKLPKTEQFGSSPHWTGGRDFPSFREIVERKLDGLGLERDAIELAMPTGPRSDSASPVPEPSAALVFGVGILVASRALTRTRER